MCLGKEFSRVAFRVSLLFVLLFTGSAFSQDCCLTDKQDSVQSDLEEGALVSNLIVEYAACDSFVISCDIGGYIAIHEVVTCWIAGTTLYSKDSVVMNGMPYPAEIDSVHDFCSDAVELGNIMTQQNGLSFVPNPFRNGVMIQLGQNGHQSGRLEIFDVKGAKVFDAAYLQKSSFVWKPEGLRPGSYFVKVTTAENTRFGKIILVK